MLHPRNVVPLTDFKRNTAEFRDRLKKTGEPLLLTVDGRADMVVLDAESFDKILGRLDFAETVTDAQAGLKDVAEGRTEPAEKVIAEARARMRRRKVASVK